MASAKEIAALAGPALMAITGSEALNFHIWAGVSPTLVTLNGALLFVAGLAILRAHRAWRLDWTVLVTLLGWLALLAGLWRLFFPEAPQAQPGLVANFVMGALFLCGAVLTWKAYWPDGSPS